MNVKIYYPAVFQKEDTGYSVWVPDISGCVSQGETISEAIENISDAIGLMLETLAEHGIDIPAPSAPEKITAEKINLFLLSPLTLPNLTKNTAQRLSKRRLLSRIGLTQWRSVQTLIFPLFFKKL